MNQRESELKLPVGSSLRVNDYSSERLLQRNTLFVGSSRLPQKLDSIPQFFDGLLKLAIELDPATDVLLSAQGTACDGFVRRIASLFGIPLLSVTMASDESELGADATLHTERDNAFSELAVVWDSSRRGVDFALANIASNAVVLSMKRNGNLHKAVVARLDAGKDARVLVDSTLTKTSLSNELLDAGARGWYLLRDESIKGTTDASSANVRNSNGFDSRKYLLHWTRRRVGPWPDQSCEEFIDDLLFRSPRKDHRSLSTLRRILATGRIFSSNELTRDQRPVVCFSDISFEELLQNRVFRPHLSRWDFEPYGIAIEKRWLEEQGAKPVVYGDESVWAALSEADRPFFQLNSTDGNVDWSVEKEWRSIGDVALQRIPVEKAFAFVPSIEDACEVQPFSRWPVVVLTKG